jgi:hypothetical protein
MAMQSWVKVIFTRHWILRLTSDRITAEIELRLGQVGLPLFWLTG